MSSYLLESSVVDCGIAIVFSLFKSDWCDGIGSGKGDIIGLNNDILILPARHRFKRLRNIDLDFRYNISEL